MTQLSSEPGANREQDTNELRTMADALETIADVWTLAAPPPLPEGRKWHCQHEEMLHAAVLTALAALAKVQGRA